jgi:hypothetical protein
MGSSIFFMAVIPSASEQMGKERPHFERRLLDVAVSLGGQRDIDWLFFG